MVELCPWIPKWWPKKWVKQPDLTEQSLKYPDEDKDQSYETKVFFY